MLFFIDFNFRESMLVIGTLGTTIEFAISISLFIMRTSVISQ
jgi:hypothetical protein